MSKALSESDIATKVNTFCRRPSVSVRVCVCMCVCVIGKSSICDSICTEVDFLNCSDDLNSMHQNDEAHWPCERSFLGSGYGPGSCLGWRVAGLCPAVSSSVLSSAPAVHTWHTWDFLVSMRTDSFNCNSLFCFHIHT